MKPTENYPDPDSVARELAAHQERDRRAAMGWPRDPGDTLRLLAIVAAVLAAHQNLAGRCMACRDETGQRARWPCAEYLLIADALLGTDSPARPAGARVADDASAAGAEALLAQGRDDPR